METAMQIELPLKSDDDVDQAIFRWRTANPAMKITKKHPVKILPLQMLPTQPGRKIEACDQFSVLMEYEEN
jgi:hypothetical protein